MKVANEFSYFIERYNNGEMSEAEKRWFEKELDGNNQLRDEVNLWKRTDEILKKKDIISLRSKLSKIESQRKKAPFTRSIRPLYARYAAVISVLMIVGTLAMLREKNISNDSIVNNYYKSYAPPTAQRSGSSEANSEFSQALELYNTKDYRNAAVLFKKVIERNPRDMQSMLLYGVSNFENNKYPEAKQSFTKVIDDDNNLFIEAAKWYLAMCYVKTNETEKAIIQLETIKSEGGIYSNDAKKIIRKLK